MSHTFTVSDADGKKHTYTVDRHDGVQGHQYSIALLAMVIEPLGKVAGPELVAAIGKAAKERKTGLAAFGAIATDPSVMSSLDTGAFSGGAASIVRRFPLPFVLGLLRFTSRDGQALVEPDGSASTAYRTEYQANYEEMYRAVWEVIRINRFFPALSTIRDAVKRAQGSAAAPSKSDG